MIKQNELKGKRIAYHKLNYANFFNGINVDFDESILPIKFSTNTYNFSFSSGALKEGLGIATLKLPASYVAGDNTMREVEFDGYEFKAFWIYRKENMNKIFGQPDVYYENFLIAQTIDGKFYCIDICSTKNFIYPISNLQMEEVPEIINYQINGEDSIVVCSKEGMWYWNAKMPTAVKVENAPKIKSVCLHYERLFAIKEGDRNSVWFSDDMNLLNWNISQKEGGFIKFADDKGIVNKLVSFKDYLYIFREYGISRLQGFANQSEFSVDQLFVSSGKIYGNSVCVCGDRILMLTQNGIYVFDGYSTKKLNLNINKMLENSQNQFVCSCYCNGKYYLACNLNFNDDKKIMCENYAHKNNALLELDVETNTLNILRGVDIRHIVSLTDEKISKVVACAVDNGEYIFGQIENCGCVLNKNLVKFWQSPLSNFGYPEKQKVLKKIYLDATAPIKLIVKTEQLKREYSLTPRNNLIELNLILKGKKIAVDFETESKNVSISSPTLIVGFV